MRTPLIPVVVEKTLVSGSRK